jgi:molecular chaperone GrpE
MDDKMNDVKDDTSADALTACAEEKIVALETEVVNLKDQLLRAIAETENVRKRYEKQLEDANKFAISSFAREMTGVLENLYRAVHNANIGDIATNNTLKVVFDGVEMTLKDLVSILERKGICRINPVTGDVFDHNLHQAVAHMPSDQFPEGTVVQIIQAGYKMHDRLLVPAMVCVAKKAIDS